MLSKAPIIHIKEGVKDGKRTNIAKNFIIWNVYSSFDMK